MIVCAKCNRAMRPKENGVSFVEMAQDRPYKLWAADLWECQDCGAQVLYSSSAQSPIAESYQEDFKLSLDSFAPQYQAKEWNRA
jgi:hypothetical protein